MADVTRSAPHTKDFGSTSIQCTMLSSANYMVWSIMMKVFLRVHEVWDTIKPGSDSKEEKCCNCSFVSICSQNFDSPGRRTNRIERLWNSIKSRHLEANRVREARLETLMTEFDRLKMDDNDTVDDFANKILGLSSKEALLGENIDVSKLVRKFSNGLLRYKYIQIIVSL